MLVLPSSIHLWHSYNVSLKHTTLSFQQLSLAFAIVYYFVGLVGTLHAEKNQINCIYLQVVKCKSSKHHQYRILNWIINWNTCSIKGSLFDQKDTSFYRTSLHLSCFDNLSLYNLISFLVTILFNFTRLIKRETFWEI